MGSKLKKATREINLIINAKNKSNLRVITSSLLLIQKFENITHVS